jgi:ATP-binding cassette, subfamily C, bacterial CydD
VRALDPRLLRRGRAVRALLAVDVAIGLATALLVLLQATLIARIVAAAFTGASLRDVSADLALLAGSFALRGLCAWAFEVAGRHAATRVLSQLRLELVERRLTDQPSALDGVETAEVAASATQGVDDLAAYFGRYLPQVILACIVPIAVLAWVAAIDLETALIMLLTLPLVPIFMWLIGRYTEERTRERWQALRLLSTHFLDAVRGLPTLRAFNRARAHAAVIGEATERYRRATMSTLRVSFLSGSVLELAATLGVALVAVTVGVRLDRGSIGFAAALTVLILAPELYLPLRQLGAQFHASADGLAVADRMLSLIDAPPAVRRTGGRRPPSPAVAEVRFEQVSFSYPARPMPVLDALDLDLRPGETVALTGASGAGKSTVAKLLLGLAEPTSGRVAVDGLALLETQLDVWHCFLAWVPQRPTVFRGSVADNIRLGKADASDAAVRRAAQLAGADSFARALPAGYDTVIGDGGRSLSVGECRRVALARAFVRDAPLVVLDEPTADLDPENAELVGEAVVDLCRDRTVLLIAHRPELAARADRIVVLADGHAAPAQERVAA